MPSSLEHNITVCDSQNATINCIRDGIYPTVVEIRSVFFGRTSTQICPTNQAMNTSCDSLESSKIALMKQCQGRHECLIEASSALLGEPCLGKNKYALVKYRCQPGK